MRDLPILFLIVVFGGLLFFLTQVKTDQPVASIVPVEHPVEQKAFTGRVVMPSLNDIYVLENSAGRDLLQFEKFLLGRAAGLHYAAASHFKKNRASRNRASKKRGKEKSPDVLMGLMLTLDSLGHFSPEILFSNTDDENLKGLVLSQVQTYWRYPRSESGRFVVWVPIAWKSSW